MILEDQPNLPGVDVINGARRAAGGVRARQPDVILLDRQAFQPDELGKLLGDLADTPIVVILSPARNNPRVQQALHAAVVALSGRAGTTPPTREQAPASHGGLAGWQIRRLEAHIDAHLEDTIHVRDLAGVTRLSLDHFAHAFKQTFGEPPLAYVTRQRLIKACDMMLFSTEPLSSIAHECGFYDQSHFTRHFHRRLGMTPQDWRRLHTNDPAD